LRDQFFELVKESFQTGESPEELMDRVFGAEGGKKKKR
jgi:hypothetical protein